MPKTRHNPIRLGLMSPLSGLVGIYGKEICWAARIAVDEINQAGGLLGCPLELVVADDGSLPETAVPAAKRLIDEHHCCALIGNLLSNSRIAVSDQVSEPHHIPYLNFSFYEGSIAGRYFFHFAALPNQQIQRMIPYMARRYGPKMYFAGNNYEWPRGSIEAAKSSLLALDGDVVGEQYLPIGTDIEAIDWLLEGVERSGADVFVPYFAGIDQIHLLTRFTERGLKRRMAVVMGHYDEMMVSHLAPAIREGLYSSNSYFMSVDTPENHAYLQQLARLPEVSGIWPAGNGVLTNFGEGTYVCVKAFASAVQTAGSTDADALVAALEQVRLRAPQGLVSMDRSTHHAQINSYLSRCRSDGVFEIVERFGAIPPEIPERYREQFRRNFFGLAYSPEDATHMAQETLQSRRQRYSSHILSIADMAVVACDETGVINEVNGGAAALFGYTQAEMVGLRVHVLVPPAVRSRHAEHLQRFVAGEQTEVRMSQRGEISGYRKDGTYFPMDASIAKIRSDAGWVLVATLRDLTDVRQAKEELTWKATHDALTGLPNRSLVLERLTHALERSRRKQENLALLFIDLDGFKEVNDHYGHEVGDYLLKTLSQRMLQTVRPGDTVGRLAGDEFVVLCEGLTQTDGMAQVAQRLAEALRREVSYQSTRLSISASIGIAIGHGTTHSAEDMLRNADTAMYAIKQKGRDGWQFFSEDVQQAALHRLEIAAGLRHAIERNELYTHYQPIVGSDNGFVQGVELLLRWRSPQGEISPAQFIPVAETTSSIIEIGRWVFEQACLMERRLHARFGEAAPYISVNLSTRQMSDSELVESFQAILARTGSDPRHLVLEITETSLMADVSANRAVLERFVAMGLDLAIDDFGTGFSSLAQLLHLRAHTLKIDRAFIDQLENRPEHQAVVAAISRMGRALKMRLVAEGVETVTQRDLVSALGIHSIQGYFFYRPMSETALLTLLTEREQALDSGNDPIHFLVYVSRPAPGMGAEQFRDIATHAAQANRSRGITGYLILLDGASLQYLEGKKSVIHALFERICQDKRHTDVSLMAEGPMDDRLFMDWHMGFHRMDDSLLQTAAGIHKTGRGVFDCYRNNPDMCCTLFEVAARLHMPH